ncbi:MAG: thioredoxin family protein [Candidatus Cyclobacteriaceae bacterium M2_1C_046]
MKYILSTFFILLSFLVSAQKEDITVNWMTFEEAVEANKKEPKKIFIDVYTDWCGWCKVMDKNTFNHPTIAKYLNENFYNVKLDAEQKEDITFNGHTFKFVASGRKGYHELAAALLDGKLSYPTVVFMDEQLRIIQPLPGYQKPEQFDPIVRFIGDDHYKQIEWESYRKEYKSSL